MDHVRITKGMKFAKKVAIIVENISGILTWLRREYLFAKYIMIEPKKAIGTATGRIGQ